MSNDARRSKLEYEKPARDPRTEPTPPGAMAVIRYTLTLSGLAMIAMAALTYAGVMPFPRWIGIMFLMVAFVDLLIGLIVFGKRRANPS